MKEQVHTNPEDSIRETGMTTLRAELANFKPATLEQHLTNLGVYSHRVAELAEEIRTRLRCSYLDGVAAGAEAEKEQETLTYKAWAARDGDGDLWLYEEKPYKIDLMWITHKDDAQMSITRFISTVLTSVKWEDEEPTHVEITIKLKR